MNVNEIINKCAEKNIQLWVKDGKLHFKSPQGAFGDELKQEVKANKEKIIELLTHKEVNIVQNNIEEEYIEFPVTDIQASYLLGRNPGYLYGGLGCKIYAEFLTEFTDENKFRFAVKKLVERQGMLRARFSKEGKQAILPEISKLPIEIYHLENETENDINREILQKRNQIQFKQYNPEKDIMFDLVLFIINRKKSVLCLSLDMLIGDYISIDVLMNDLEQIYSNQQIVPLKINYRDYITYTQHQREDINFLNKFYEDKAYWKNKIDLLPGKPEIYTSVDFTDTESKTFFQKKYTLNISKWEKFEEKCRKYHITPTAMMLLLYCLTLKQWSKNKDFLINITVMQRPNIHDDIQKIIGDFTSTTLFEFKESDSNSIKEQATQTQKILFDNLTHNAFSGIEVLRELKRKDKESIIPYVFTSTVGSGNKENILQKRQLLYKISETPQVLIDCQVSKTIDGVLVNWDVREGVFPRGLIDEMFESFTEYIHNSVFDEFWENKLMINLGSNTRKIRKKINDTEKLYENKNLIESFFMRCRKNPDRTVLICGEEKFSYSKLENIAATIQTRLLENGIKKGDKVGVLLEKGGWQIASVIAILSLGAVYVPIDASQPKERIYQIVDQANIKLNIYQKEEERITEKDIRIDLHDISSKNGLKYECFDSDVSAYCIFTSGSTGIPKGVEMTHAAAMNTIMDICSKFEVSDDDKILGISNLYFDLSVFDIFAAFYANATLILPLESRKKDVSHWYELCTKYHITVYNMVPAQMEMFMAYLQVNDCRKNVPRLILLSGDWIPANLIKNIRTRFPKTQCVGLGGATEAGIWSIYFPTDKMSETDRNVPYGIPLSNQRFYILDENDNPCADYVIGEICIAGKSLAKGYMNDPELTNNKFQYIGQINERIYRTGDLGLYREDGIIEFVGRKDTQVKVNGYRVELGEIENALRKYKKIENAVAVRNNNGELIAYVSKNNGTITAADTIAEKKKICEAEFGFTFTKEDFHKWIEAADNTAQMYILALMRKEGMFNCSEEKYSPEDIVKLLKVKPQYHQLIIRWLTALKDKKFICEEKGMFYAKTKYADDIAEKAEEDWKLIDRKIGYSDVLMNYIHSSSTQLKDLLTGKKHPNELLFPQGKLDIAYAAYKDNIVNRSINKVLHEEILEILNKNRQNIRILEIGAGVAGSSLELIEKLHPYNVEYYFTDVSKFFFNEAKKLFSQYNWINYKIYDINKCNWDQGFEGEKFDIILCGNVLHNAEDIKKSLTNIRKMLKNEGKLFIIEEVKKRYALLTSMEFEFAEAVKEYSDGRKSKESIFINYEEWKNIIKEMEGHIILSYPEEDDVLYSAGQVLMEVQFSSENDLDINEIESYLKTKVPEYMIPSKIIELNEFPMSSNGKIDRKKLSIREEKYRKDKVNEVEPLDDLENRIKNIWCEIIGCKEIGRDEDFYSVGGDSLLVAQTISQMMQKLPETKGWKWDALMMALMKNATIKGIAEVLRGKISETTEEKSENISPFISFKEPEKDCEKAKILFHAGTGTLSSYKDLLPYLAKSSRESELLGGFNFGSFEEYLNRDVDSLIIDTAKRYADILEKISTNQYILMGYCVGGWIAFETARILVERGKNVAKVVTISSSLCGHNYDNELLLERAFALSIGADIEKAGYIGSNTLLQRALENFKTHNGDRAISIDELCTLSGEYEELAVGFKKLSELSQEERLQKIFATIKKNEGDDAENIDMFKILYKLFRHSFKGIMRYEPSIYVGDVHALFVADDTKHFFPVRDISNKELWENIVLGDLTIDYIPGEHTNCLKEPNVHDVAKILE